jgi:YfiH family protein
MSIQHSTSLCSIDGIVHGFGVGTVGLESHLKAQNIQNYFSFSTEQVHGRRVHVLRDKPDGRMLYGDAFITDRPCLICHVRTADCVPILIADRRNRSVAAIHAGWRGTSLDVVGATVQKMNRAFKTDPSDCFAAIGPRICGSCYEVGAEVVEALQKLEIDESWRLEKNCVDLGVANELLLIRAGVPSNKIDMLTHCTCCDERFASWRRDRTARARQVNYIMINI